MISKIKIDERPRKYVTPNCSHDNWVEKVNENLDRILDEDMFINCLQKQWEMNEAMFPIDQRRNPPYMANTLVDSFNCYLDMGFVPPPEILLAMMETFQTYFNSCGEVSLEEVFFGKPKKGVGNYAARRTNEIGGLYGNFRFFKAFECEGMTQTEAAEAYLEKERKLHAGLGLKFEMDVDSFLRGVRRWNKRQIEMQSEADKKKDLLSAPKTDD